MRRSDLFDPVSGECFISAEMLTCMHIQIYMYIHVYIICTGLSHCMGWYVILTLHVIIHANPTPKHFERRNEGHDIIVDVDFC